MPKPALAETMLQPWLSTCMVQCTGSCLSVVALARVCWDSSIGAAASSEGHPQPGALAQLHLLSCNLPLASSAALCTNIPLPCNNLQLGAREEDGGWRTSSFLSLLGKYGTRGGQVQPKGILHAASRGHRRPASNAVAVFLSGSRTVAAGGDCGMFRGSEGKQLPGWLPRLESLTVERVLGLHTSNKQPFFRFPLKYFSYFAMAACVAPSYDSSSPMATV